MSRCPLSPLTPPTAGTPAAGGVGRRRFLQGAAAVLGTMAAGASTAAAAEDGPAGGSASIAFEGPHQAGVLQPVRAAAAFVAFDVVSRNRAQLAELMRELTDRARFLTAGGVPPQLGISAPPSDSGVLGPVVTPGNLTVTVGLGSSLFDGRFGLGPAKPAQLRPMDTFPNDDLDRTRCDGDLLVQLVADDADTVIHALRDLTRATRGGMQVRWRVNGFVSPPRPSGTPRNLLGFRDGTANPDVTDAATMSRLVWAGSGEPDWAGGGTYQVVRIIRMFTEFWDRVSLSEQERMIGRRRDSGAPLTGSTEQDIPDYADDPQGGAIPLDAHIRLANPRTPQTADSLILRRAYNYDDGVTANGDLDMGLIFTCFQRDLDRQFVATQTRLIDEPLVDYILPVAGGYFFTLPGVRDAGDWYASALLS